MVCLDFKAVIRQKLLNTNKQRTRKMKIGIRERPTDPVLNDEHNRAFRSLVGELRIGAKKWKIGATKGVNPSLTPLLSSSSAHPVLLSLAVTNWPRAWNRLCFPYY